MSDIDWLSGTLTFAERGSYDNLAHQIDSELTFFSDKHRRMFWREQVRDYTPIIGLHKAFEAIQLYGRWRLNEGPSNAEASIFLFREAEADAEAKNWRSVRLACIRAQVKIAFELGQAKEGSKSLTRLIDSIEDETNITHYRNEVKDLLPLLEYGGKKQLRRVCAGIMNRLEGESLSGGDLTPDLRSYLRYNLLESWIAIEAHLNNTSRVGELRRCVLNLKISEADEVTQPLAVWGRLQMALDYSRCHIRDSSLESALTERISSIGFDGEVKALNMNISEREVFEPRLNSYREHLAQIAGESDTQKALLMRDIIESDHLGFRILFDRLNTSRENFTWILLRWRMLGREEILQAVKYLRAKLEKKLLQDVRKTIVKNPGTLKTQHRELGILVRNTLEEGGFVWSYDTWDIAWEPLLIAAAVINDADLM